VTACVETYPQLGWLSRFHEDSRMRGDGAIPRWFEDWLNAGRAATSLRIWQPSIVPGLLQTTDYARALCRAGTLSTGDEEVEQQVTARMARQRIFDRPDPPNLRIVLDEAVLHRLIGTPKITYDQLIQLADMSMRSCICVQIVPADTGAHAGLAGSFYLANVQGKPDLLYMDAVEGVTIERSALVRKAAVAFDLVRSDALTRNDSRDLILKVAEERWNA
jgi:hypothetical protein